MKTVVFGNGAMSRVVYSHVRKTQAIAGFVVDRSCLADGQERFLELPIRPFDEMERWFPPSSHRILLAVGFVDMNRLRADRAEQALEKGYALQGYVDPSFRWHDDVQVEDGAILLENVVAHPGTRIESGAFLSSNVSIGHDCVVGAHAWINSGVSIAGGCHVGGRSFLGVNSCLAHGVSLGARTFVGANTLVSSSTAEGEVRLAEAGTRFRMDSGKFLEFTSMLGGDR